MQHACDFRGELLEPLHPLLLGAISPRRAEDETEITHGWAIILPSKADLILQNAVDDFRDFLSASFGISLKSIEAQGRSGSDVLMILNESLPPRSFEVTVDEKRIAIHGADSQGIMHGLFHLENLMTEREAPFLKHGKIRRVPAFETRILRAYHAPFYENELDSREDFYTDDYLARLAHESFNGIWLHQRLRDLVVTRTLPNDGADIEPPRPLPFGMRRRFSSTTPRQRMERLNTLIARARRWDIGVYLYLNEPRALPCDSTFFKKHPHVAGHRETWNEMEGSPDQAYYAMCTSSPEVLAFLEEGAAELFRQARELAGVFLITQSEHLTHCWSRTYHTRGETTNCPRCVRRDPAEIIPEVVTHIARGAHAVNPRARVLVWTWGWDQIESAPYPRTIAHLPKGIQLMPDFERGQWIEEDGLKWLADEYTLSRPGPSAAFQMAADEGKKAGHPIYAKIQIGNTHELANTPFIPVPFKLFEKFVGMHRAEVEGYVGCWAFGNYPSIMTAVAHEMGWLPTPGNADDLLTRLACRRYGSKAAAAAVEAWRQFSGAFGHFPMSQSVIYLGPVHYAPLWHFPLRGQGRPFPMYWLMRGPEDMGDTLDWAKLDCERKSEKMIYEGPVRAEHVLRCFEDLDTGWNKGLACFKRAMIAASPMKRALAEKDAGIAKAIGIHFSSTVRILRFLLARDRFETGDEPALDAMRELMEKELVQRQIFLDLVRNDSRIGFHSEFGYTFQAEDVATAIERLKQQIESARRMNHLQLAH